jgi:hypothetical protein
VPSNDSEAHHDVVRWLSRLVPLVGGVVVAGAVALTEHSHRAVCPPVPGGGAGGCGQAPIDWADVTVAGLLAVAATTGMWLLLRWGLRD